MKLKNTALLVERAKAHRDMHNLVSGTYGSNAADGDPTQIKACAIGCLSAPHEPAAFAALMAEVGESGMWGRYEETLRLEDTFGISLTLADLAESGFESHWHSERFGYETAVGQEERANYVVAFAEALADGVEEFALWRAEDEGDPPSIVASLAEICGKPVPKWAADLIPAA